MKASIKLKLKVKDVELEFTKDEIKELKDLLDELFPRKEIIRDWYPWRYLYTYNYIDKEPSAPSHLNDTTRWIYDANGTASVFYDG